MEYHIQVSEKWTTLGMSFETIPMLVIRLTLAAKPAKVLPSLNTAHLVGL